MRGEKRDAEDVIGYGKKGLGRGWGGMRDCIWGGGWKEKGDISIMSRREERRSDQARVH